MGLDFIRAKTAAYIQKRDLSRLISDTRELRERGSPDRIVELFGVQLRDPTTQLVPGYRILVSFASETEAVVMQNGRTIGDLDAEAAKDLAERLKATGQTSGMLDVLIHGTQDISGCFKVKAAEPKNIRKE